MRNKRYYLNESSMGAGYSYSSSIFPSTRSGFGGASNLGGPNMMYTYEIKPLNRNLQPQVSKKITPSIIIHPGLIVQGKKINDKRGMYVGKLLQIVKANNGSLRYYIILDQNTGEKIKLDPTTVDVYDAARTAEADDLRLELQEIKDKKIVSESLDEFFEKNNEINESS